MPNSIFLALSLLIASATLAEARDRAPNRHEFFAIKDVLLSAGFVGWRRVELDDGYWEVDDAIGPDGREYDVTIDPVSLRIVEVDD